MNDKSPRSRTLSYLHEHPGACIQDIADHLGVARSSALHHVRVLHKQRAIVTQRKGRRVLHFPVQVGDDTHRSLLAVWRVGTARRILEQLHDDPTRSWRSIARHLDITPRAVRWHLHRMEEEGLLRIERSPDGSRHETVIHPRLRSLAEHGEAPLSPPHRR